MTAPRIRARVRDRTQPTDRPAVFKTHGRWIALWNRSGPTERPRWTDYRTGSHADALAIANRVAGEIAASRRRVENGP